MRHIAHAHTIMAVTTALCQHFCLLPPLQAHAADLSNRVPLLSRITAAQSTANQAEACVIAQPFYWEVGNSERMLSGGQAGTNAPSRQTEMALASASKWLYAAYVAEQRQGVLSAQDARFLSFQSGYTRFRICLPGQTVAQCQSSPINGLGRIDTSTIGLFDYDGGHMQKHATLMGLGPLGNAALATAIKQGLQPLGSDWVLNYSQPQLAGGAVSNAASYARFLRATLKGDLKMSTLLGTHAVCTNPQTCPGQALETPIPQTETWHYSVGHWVEDDPVAGDGAFSSAGAFGFYPWIDASKQFYGIVARDDRGTSASSSTERPGRESANCGRLIRKAWLTGQPQP